MTFGEVIEGLREGRIFYRQTWGLNKRLIYKNNNTDVPESIIPKMGSLPNKIKAIAYNFGFLFLSYRNQVISINLEKTTAEAYIPSWEDMFAIDWEEHV